MAKQIADLGNEISQLYAQQQAQREQDRAFLSDTSHVPNRTVHTVLLPTAPPELTRLLKTDLCNKPSGEYNIPEGYNSYASNLFTHALAPNLGTEEKMEADMQNITGIKEKSNQELDPTNPELQQRNEEAHKVLTGLETMTMLNKVLTDVKSKQGMFKG